MTEDPRPNTATSTGAPSPSSRAGPSRHPWQRSHDPARRSANMPRISMEKRETRREMTPRPPAASQRLLPGNRGLLRCRRRRRRRGAPGLPAGRPPPAQVLRQGAEPCGVPLPISGLLGADGYPPGPARSSSTAPRWPRGASAMRATRTGAPRSGPPWSPPPARRGRRGLASSPPHILSCGSSWSRFSC
jgi:hypothetical protein